MSRFWRWVVCAVLLSACSGGTGTAAVQPEGDFLPFADRIDLVVECVESRGFEASSYEGFGVMVSAVGEKQLEVATQEEGECWEEVEERFPTPPALSVDESYYYYLEVARCLEDLGYEIPDPPTLDTYKEQIASQSDTWNPYTYLALQRVNTWELQRECPPETWAR